MSDDPTNIDKYRLAANITEYYIISKLILQQIIIPKFMMIRQLFHVKSLVEIGPLVLWFRESFEVNFNIGFGIPFVFPSQRKNIIQSIP